MFQKWDRILKPVQYLRLNYPYFQLTRYTTSRTHTLCSPYNISYHETLDISLWMCHSNLSVMCPCGTSLASRNLHRLFTTQWPTSLPKYPLLNKVFNTAPPPSDFRIYCFSLKKNIPFSSDTVKDSTDFLYYTVLEILLVYSLTWIKVKVVSVWRVNGSRMFEENDTSLQISIMELIRDCWEFPSVMMRQCLHSHLRMSIVWIIGFGPFNSTPYRFW